MGRISTARVPDWVFVLAGHCCDAYMFFFGYGDGADRSLYTRSEVRACLKVLTVPHFGQRTREPAAW